MHHFWPVDDYSANNAKIPKKSRTFVGVNIKKKKAHD
jgi:hypothetical protein